MGLLVLKLTPVGTAGWPDRLFINLNSHGMMFVEFKRKGGRVSPLQLLRLQQLRKKNVAAVVIDNVSDGVAAVNSLMQT